ncbi:MAG: NBR1-Ig-like domain-containing protein [Anaerolineales bacterium]|nr:MAG: NBR1-Ig-like domain-containing protein [Anaerolineales bacterium]
MKSRKLIWLVGATILAVTLSSCNIGATPAPAEDPGAIQTQSFSIVLTQAVLQQTQTALAIPPTPLPTNTQPPTVELPTFSPLGTNTPFAFNTQQPGVTPLASLLPTVGGVVSTVTTKNGCNDAAYLGEGGVKDGDEIDAGKNFSKSFMLLNTGECSWDEGYGFMFVPEFTTPGFQGINIVLPKNKPEDYTKPGAGQTFVLKLTAPKTVGTYKAYWKLRDDVGNFFGPLVWLEIVVK